MIKIDKNLCKGCKLCQIVCPKNVIQMAESSNEKGIKVALVANPDSCIHCSQCELVCPEMAIYSEEQKHPSQSLKKNNAKKSGGEKEVSAALAPGNYFMLGDEACAEGALAAGCNFFAGYPITPASEVMIQIVNRAKENGLSFIQMEDEIASIAACIGASWAGRKSMTATSGPGFSLMMENLGYAFMTETPLVIVDVQRAGPSTGQATKLGQGDFFQAKYGMHGEGNIIALAPWSVQEMYDLTIKAFNLSEKYRNPAVILADEGVGHLLETFTVKENVTVYNRKVELGRSHFGPEEVPPMAHFGDGESLLVTGSTHDERGVRKTQDPEVQAVLVERLHAKVTEDKDDLVDLHTAFLEDAKEVIVSFGINARSCYYAVEKMREKGRKMGFIRPKIMWPFPRKKIQKLTENCEKVYVFESNFGQLALLLEAALSIPVFSYHNYNGRIIKPDFIFDSVNKQGI